MAPKHFISKRSKSGRTSHPYSGGRAHNMIGRSVLLHVDIGMIRQSSLMYREHDELRYSIRGLFKYFNKGFSQIRIISTDLRDGKKWVGQIPSWLDLEAAKTNRVSMYFTSMLYGSLKSLLPVFNSLALESQFKNIPPVDPNNDVMVYFNDDMFLASEHSVSDFWNPVSGLNINVDHRAWVENQNPAVSEFQRDWNSEWPTLRHSNFLLSMTFFRIF